MTARLPGIFMLLAVLLSGCATEVTEGESLSGGEWVVEDIGERGVIDYSRITLTFGDDGRLSGLAGCNTYSAPYEVSGDSLTIGRAIATLRACVPALDNQEQTFLRILAGIDRYDFSETGALILATPEGETLTARR